MSTPTKTEKKTPRLFIEELESRTAPVSWTAYEHAGDNANYHSPVNTPILTTLATCEEDLHMACSL